MSLKKSQKKGKQDKKEEASSEVSSKVVAESIQRAALNLDFLENDLIETKNSDEIIDAGEIETQDEESDVIDISKLGQKLEFTDEQDEDDSEDSTEEVLEGEDELALFDGAVEDALVESEELAAEVEEEDEEDPEVAASAAESDELAGFQAAELEEVEFIEQSRAKSIVESFLFASDRPVSMDLIRQIFKGTNYKGPQVKKLIEEYKVELAGGERGISLEEVAGGLQLRTKPDNANFLKRSFKVRPFKLSGPALEVLSIVAYKQPVIKSDIDEIRGVESGHLLRALMDRGIVRFGGKSELPGKPMFYETSRKFLEIFGLRSLQELPTPSEIDQLIPEGIGEVEEEKKLSDLTADLSLEAAKTYSEGEAELLQIGDQLSQIETTTQFFELEKQREKDRKDQEKAQDIREALVIGQTVETKDKRWLERYEKAQLEKAQAANPVVQVEQPAVEAEIAQEEQSEVVSVSASEETENVATSESEDEINIETQADVLVSDLVQEAAVPAPIEEETSKVEEMIFDPRILNDGNPPENSGTPS